jgi:hypothetical protein
MERRGRRIERHLEVGARRVPAGGSVVQLGLQPGERPPNRALHHEGHASDERDPAGEKDAHPPPEELMHLAHVVREVDPD